jgi:Na+-translocating ferredoxin:NAD+ oxidoreductase subunit B
MIEALKFVLISMAIAAFLGAVIVLVNVLLPKEEQKSGKVEQILKIIPKRDCGACGYPGCEKYAQAIAQNPELALKDKCPFMPRDKEKLAELEKILNVKIKKEKQ